MSAGGHSFHKKDWAQVGGLAALAATGAGAAGVGPLAGLLGTSSGAAAAAAGDAFMPAALGAGGEGAASLGQLAGAKMAGLMNNPLTALKGGVKGLNVANKLGLFGQQPQAMAAAMPMPTPPPGLAPTNTQVAPQSSSLTPEQLKALLALLQQQQQG